MKVVADKNEYRALCDEFRKDNERLGFVPTMGALHDGHLALVDYARTKAASRIAMSIFVNPTQFGPNEDLAKYPRTLEQDLQRCSAAGVDLVFVPSAETMYPEGFCSQVEVPPIAADFEGAIRPGHFRGVATVVTKLFQLTGPCVSIFGQKDYQQLKVIERMVKDLDYPVEVHGMPTIREEDGLAMSSRNRYLDPDQRTRAVAISQALKMANAAYLRGEPDPEVLEQEAKSAIEMAFDSVDYVTLCDADTLAPLPEREWRKRPSVILVAAKLGNTRLLDNAVLGDPSFV